jgi:hypothetical protein
VDRKLATHDALKGRALLITANPTRLAALSTFSIDRPAFEGVSAPIFRWVRVRPTAKSVRFTHA